ncbi:MAG: hypothetical protein WC587_02055 [Candidatus Paceibacterota bacterium]
MDGNSLKKLKNRLYRRNESFPDRKKEIRILGKKEEVMPTNWGNSVQPKEVKPQEVERPIFLSMKKIFIIAVAFLALSVLAVFYFWSRGVNIISSRNINIEIKSPVDVKGGELFSLDASVENKNNSALELSDLIVVFPVGFFSTDGQVLGRERYSLGAIKPGETNKKTLSLSLLGEENEIKDIKVTLEYRLEGSNAIFAKDIDYQIKISRPAVGVSLIVPQEVNARQQTKIDVELVSNSEIIIKDTVLMLEYPSGFQFVKADPKPSSKNNIWQIGDFNSSQQRKISIFGIIEGQDLEEKAFKASAGIMDKDGVFVSFGSSSQTLVVKKPFLDMAFFINGKNPEDAIIYPGENVQGEIVWKNNLLFDVRDATLEIKLNGKALNENLIRANSGFYRTFDKTLVWNPSSMSKFGLIKPGETGSNIFTFNIIEPLPVSNASDSNFTITADAQIKGKGSSVELGETEIQNLLSKSVKISSLLQLASRMLHYSGSLDNSGPMPPKAGQETTYSVVWSIGNVSNNFSDVKVKAILPSFVRWTNKIYPSSENISFNETTGEVVWNAGNIGAGTGILNPAKEVSFQISFLPSLGQIGSTPVLVSDISIEGKDNFTGNAINETKQNLDIRLTNDPLFDYTKGTVVK